ncbi:MAG: hypothetical protein JXQ75_22995 [Phycisphaerae bacterium]|nr:hypothetical protein [Phycisphaerae bacterium]
MPTNTIRKLHEHNRWANDRVMRDPHDAACRLADLRATWLDSLGTADLGQRATHAPDHGVTYTDRLGDTLMRVRNHRTRRRARGLNMPRQVGADVPEVDPIESVWETAGTHGAT